MESFILTAEMKDLPLFSGDFISAMVKHTLLVEFYDDQMEIVIVNGFFCNEGTIKKMGPSDLMEALDLEPGWEDRFQLQIAFLDI